MQVLLPRRIQDRVLRTISTRYFLGRHSKAAHTNSLQGGPWPCETGGKKAEPNCCDHGSQARGPPEVSRNLARPSPPSRGYISVCQNMCQGALDDFCPALAESQQWKQVRWPKCQPRSWAGGETQERQGNRADGGEAAREQLSRLWNLLGGLTGHGDLTGVGGSCSGC